MHDLSASSAPGAVGTAAYRKEIPNVTAGTGVVALAP